MTEVAWTPPPDDEPRSYRPEMPPPVHVEGRKLRIGDRVRCTKGDVFLDIGEEGLVVNVAPPRPYAPGRARVLWDSEKVSMIDATDFDVITPEPEPAVVVQPTVMGPFGRSA